MCNNKLSAVPFTSVQIQDQFWKPKLKTHKDVTLKACLDKCERTGRIDNFSKAAGLLEGDFEGIYFNDSDVYKVIEGAAYSLMSNPDPELERKIDDIIDKIEAAQEDNGYLLCYYTLVEPNKKWTDMNMHEMYCGGHLIEAAVAYYKATNKDKLLKVACKLADHYDSNFGPGKRHWVTGHPEVELALVKLYQETKEERYLKLANWLLEERGHGYGKGYIWDRDDWGPAYCQDDKPVKELSRVSGHAVRAMYLYTGIADVAAITGNMEYIKALDRLWENVVYKNMYITGGIGSSKKNEGFTEDYDLPNETAYCETCASVGMALWNHRMNLLHGDGKYADILEKVIYNGVLAGVSLDGERFFYDNPLASDGTHHRKEWYDCSCCPTQIARFIPSIGNYIYNVSEEGIWVNLYLANETQFEHASGKVKLTQTTNYPWDGKIDISIDTTSIEPFEINLRFPGWCKSATLYINDQPLTNYIIDKGYIKIKKQWKQGDMISIEFDMPVEKVYAQPKVVANLGKVAIQKGPIVYCMEEIDNKTELDSIFLDNEVKFMVEYKKDMLGGINVIKAIQRNGDEYILIPYFAWDNRDDGWMIVWINERETVHPLPLYTL